MNRHWTYTHSKFTMDCDLCREKFDCITDLVIHKYVNHNSNKKNHTENQEFKCNFCYRICPDRSTFKIHLGKFHSRIVN